MIVQKLSENLAKGNEKKIIALSSRRGSIQLSREDNYTDRFGYRSSKAALNAEMSALALSMPTITVLILHPGRVSTALTNFDPMGISVEKSIEGMTKLISVATIAQSGKFYSNEGQEMPW